MNTNNTYNPAGMTGQHLNENNANLRKDEHDGKTHLAIFAPTSFEGVSGASIVRDMFAREGVEIHFKLGERVDFREYQNLSGYDVVILLGIPYKGYNLPQGFYTSLDVPFTTIVHTATFGEEIQGEHIRSLVEPGVDPVKQLYSLLTTAEGISTLTPYMNDTERLRDLIEAVHAYRTWTWEDNSLTKSMLALYHAAYTNLPYVTKDMGLSEMIKKYAPIIKGQITQMNNYIKKKKEESTTVSVMVDEEECVMIVAFAENYVNETANYIMETADAGSKPVIVCVGRPTKGDDMFSIRTKGVHAGKVAQYIHGGKGTEEAASMFVDINYSELMARGFKELLSDNSM